MQEKITDPTDQALDHMVIRVSKEDSSFIYFIFESNEGMCFYSTLKSSLQKEYRDVSIYFTPEFREDVERTLNILSNKFPIEYLTKELT
jgi:hypothetical protein